MPDDAVIMQKWRSIAYTPHNNMLSVVFDTRSYNRHGMRRAAQRITDEGRDRIASDEERIIHAWYTLALNDLVEQAATTPGPPIRLGTASITSLVEFICSLPVLPFRGLTPPPSTIRWTNGKEGQMVDIVPSDPRWGWEDIPDWKAEGL